MRIVYAEDLFVTPVEQEFQRLIAVEVLKAIRESKSREPPWQQALRRKPPRKQNNQFKSKLHTGGHAWPPCS